jgi:hypothetical protein
MHSSISLRSLLLAVALVGCESTSEPAGPATAGGAPAGGSAGAAGSAVTAGSSPGGAGAAGAAAGGAGAGNGGSSGGVTPLGGGGTGGGAGTGGGGGTGGSSAEDPLVVAQALDGFAILKPCVNWTPSGMQNNGDCCCEELAASENQHISTKLGGDPQVTYQVKLRIAGVAERYWYAGGQLDAANKIFYSGGLPTIHSQSAPNDGLGPGQGACKIHPPQTDGQFALPFAVPDEIKPADGCYNGFNIFALTVSSPKKSYYLNATMDFDGQDRQPHSVYKTDYTVTIPISGQAELDFYTIDGDHHQVTNNGTMTVPDVKTAQPYNGNFLELTVLEVKRADPP